MVDDLLVAGTSPMDLKIELLRRTISKDIETKFIIFYY